MPGWGHLQVNSPWVSILYLNFYLINLWLIFKIAGIKGGFLKVKILIQIKRNASTASSSTKYYEDINR